MKVVKTDADPLNSDQEAADAISKLGDLVNQALAIETIFNKRVKALERRKNRELRPREKEIAVLLALISDYMEKHRKRFNENVDGKTIVFDTGEVKWKFISSLHISNTQVLIRCLEKLGLKAFVQIKKTVKKKELSRYLKEHDIALKGVRHERDEELYIKPNHTVKSVVLKRSQISQLKFMNFSKTK